MINLLPAEPEQALHVAYRGRLLVVSGFLFSALLLMALIIIGVLYWSVTARSTEVAAALAKERAASTVTTTANLETDLKLFGRKASLLSTMASSTAFAAVIQNVLVSKTAGIALTDFSYSSSGLLRLAGVAQTRDRLLAFIDALRNDSLFASVDSPVSNLIKDRDADFVINLQVHE